MILTGFHHTYTVFGSVSKGTVSVDGVRTELYFTTVGKETANGIFFGDAALSKKLRNILLSSGVVKFIGVWTSKSASYRIEFIIDGITFSRYRGPMETDKLCEFTCNQLTIKLIYESEEINKKLTKAKISYCIPYRRELILPKIPKDFDSKYKDWLEYETEFGKLKIEYLPYEDKAKVGVNEGRFLVNELQLSVEVDFSTEELFLEKLRHIDEVVENYLLLISIICLGKTDYYKKVINYFGSNGYCYNQTYQIFDRKDHKGEERFMLFEWHTSDELLKNLVPLLVKHQNKYDILETIKLFLAAIHSEFEEVKLLLMQGAIETAVNSVYESLGFDEKKCSKCNKDLVIFKDKLIAILKNFNVKFDDLYPSVAKSSNESFPFILYRNRFVHGRRNEINYNDIVNETYRQQYLVERLIVNWIGYDSNKLDYLKLWEGIKPY